MHLSGCFILEVTVGHLKILPVKNNVNIQVHWSPCLCLRGGSLSVHSFFWIWQVSSKHFYYYLLLLKLYFVDEFPQTTMSTWPVCVLGGRLFVFVLYFSCTDLLFVIKDSFSYSKTRVVHLSPNLMTQSFAGPSFIPCRWSPNSHIGKEGKDLFSSRTGHNRT